LIKNYYKSSQKVAFLRGKWKTRSWIEVEKKMGRWIRFVAFNSVNCPVG
jgi:hypothetical protein